MGLLLGISEGLEEVTGMTAVFIALYFLPGFVAAMRGHHNVAAIVVLNLFLGWTLLGWVVALVWAMTVVREK